MKVVTLNNKAFQNSCDILFSKLQHNFDVVLGIKRGGEYVLDVFKEHNEDSISTIKTVTLQSERDSSLKKSKYIRFIIRCLPYFVLNKLRVYEAKVLQWSTNRTDISGDVDIDITDLSTTNVKSILVLDDAMDTGKTMTKVVNTLRRTIPDADIHVGVLSWTNSKSLVTPHYYVYKDVLVRFPWSLDYKRRSDAG